MAGRFAKLWALLGLIALVSVASAHDRPGKDRDDTLYSVTPLVSDQVTLGKNPPDPDLVNAWGIAATPTSFWWVSDNGTGKSTLYDGDGNKQTLVVSVAGGTDEHGKSTAAPTGVVANTGTSFAVTGGPAHFIFASEDGTISGWNSGTSTEVKVNHGTDHGDAVYKGIAIDPAGKRLYAADFHNGRVDVFDGADWHPIDTGGRFQDRALPAGYAPFGMRVIGNRLFVTYAQQDADRHDDVKGPGHGFVDEFTLGGTLVRRVATRGKLDSPWGLALAPDGFGSESGHLLVGNFGDGRIVSFELPGQRRLPFLEDRGGEYLEDANGPITIDGLWGIGFGNGNHSAPTSTLFFAAGPGDESHGLFGRIDAVPPDPEP